MFDFFRVLRKIFKTSNFFTYIQDIIFWVFTGVSILYSMYKFNSGEIRLYVFVGLLIGAIIYFITISKYIININVIILKAVCKICEKIFIKQQHTLNSYKNEKTYITSKISEQKDYKKELADKKDNVNSKEYIEQVAREKLNMYMPNERVYIDVGN